MAAASIIVRDIPVRKERELAEEELRESTEALAEAQRIGALGCHALDIPTRQWKSSETLDDIFGIGKDYDRTVGGWSALIHPADNAPMNAYFVEKVIGQGKPFDRQYRVVRQADQGEQWVHGTGKLVFDSQGKPRKVHGAVRNITEQRLSEMRLRDSEARYRETFDKTAFGIVHTSFEGRYLWCDPRFAEIIGFPQKDVATLTVQQTTPLEDLAKNKEIRQRASNRTIDNACWERRYIRKDGSTTWGRVTTSTERDSQGREIHFIEFVEGINARKEVEQRLAAAQEALRTREQHYQTIFQTSLDAIVITGPDDGRCIDLNQAFLDSFGYECNEVIGLTVLELNLRADPSGRRNFVELLHRQANCRNLEVKFRRKSGEAFSSLASASIIEPDVESCILSLLRDISDLRDGEKGIKNLVSYDPLTHLPNRSLLMDRLNEAPLSIA